MTDFNLHKLIREVCDTSTIADPATLAKEVGKRIGRNQERAAVEQALPVLVQHVVSRSRTSSSPGDHMMGDNQSQIVAGGRSRKVANIRETWRRMLRDRVAVSSGSGDWKFLGDCTATDLGVAASIREDHARRNAARAEQFRRLAELLDEHDIETVRDLPDTVLATTFVEHAKAG